MVLMGFGALIWFIPPWASAIMYPDAASAYLELGNKAADAVYLVFARNSMPTGTVGLLLAGLFAASMSSMDSALNKNSGIFVRSVYEPYLARRDRNANEQQLLLISRGLSFASGVIVIFMALYFKSLRELSLFDLMMSVSAMIQVPLLIPLILGLFIRNTPRWAPWATVVLGLGVSWFMQQILTPQVVADWLGLAQLTSREATDLNLILTLGAHLFITAGFFWATALFYASDRDDNAAERARFFKDWATPVIADEQQDDYDRLQRAKLAGMVTCMGLGIFLMVLIPNPLWGRALFAACALCILAIGYLLRRSARQI